MLYQKHTSEYHTENQHVVHFGSNSLSKWQQSYGPTNLELLGMVTSILDCASCLRGQQFVLECDHQAINPLFQKNIKSAIYERWVAILQSFNFESRYKKAEKTTVPDALSIAHSQYDPSFSSLDEEDPYFPYVPDNKGKIPLPGGGTLQEFLSSDKAVQLVQFINHMALPQNAGICLQSDNNYDSDSEIIDTHVGQTKHRLIKKVEYVDNRRY